MSKFGDCEKKVTHKKIVLEENKSKITFNNPKKQFVRVILIDGCVIKSGVRCDNLVIDNISIEYFVELKGSDVNHAVDQIIRTIELTSNNPKSQHKYCFIISSRCPLLSPEIQILKKKFKKCYNAILIIKNTYYEHNLN
ncbi:hypothetical protein ACFLSV_01325 [Bacteroidota bacterium]